MREKPLFGLIDVFRGLRPKKTDLEQSAYRINTTFRNGGNALDVLRDIRRFPRPIAVDFNNVIANNSAPLELNPDAPGFLQDLRQIGNIFIATSSPDWVDMQRFLKKHNLWSNDTVLMTKPTYAFIHPRSNDPGAVRLRREFLNMAHGLGWNYTEDDLRRPDSKVLAPIFAKPFLVPLIDDLKYETENNPGILGITVQTWEGEAQQAGFINYNRNLPTLSDAVNLVRNHYASLEPAN